jgi:hypothetical protein
MSGMPRAPEGVSVELNMANARARCGRFANAATYNWFYQTVRHGGPMDYKQRGYAFQDFGNFNYGAVGYAIGIPEEILLRGAGFAQRMAGTSLPEYGTFWGKPPYGDDPADQRMIKEGIRHARHAGF